MDNNKKLQIKEELKKHLFECEKALNLLEQSTLTHQENDSLDEAIRFLKLHHKNHDIPIEEGQKFLELMNSVPSIAIQGYNIEREVIYWNKPSEKIYGYTAEEACGKKLEDLILPEGMAEAAITSIDDWYHKGIAIPPSELMLKCKDQSIAHVYSSHVMLISKSGELEMYCMDIDISEKAFLRDKNKHLAIKAHEDNLTKTYNRHYFDSIIEQKMQLSVSQKTPLSLIMFDLDDFKKVNDEFGHDIGDLALIELVSIVRNTIREEDILVRWGGEEFLILIEADQQLACHIANKIRMNIEEKTIKLQQIPNLTCSFGVIEITHFPDFQNAFIAVDKMLLLAKQRGKNRVES